MTDEQLRLIEWIDNADYEALFYRWRFAAIGDPLFQGEVGEYYNKVFMEKRREITDEEHTRLSKKMGWKT